MNKRNLYALAAMTAVALPAFSRPASPELFRHTNPDGTVVEFYTVGDENFHYYTDADRNVILEMKGKTLTPMMRNGRRMVVNDTNVALLKSEVPADPTEQQSVAAGKVNRMAALDINGRSTYPTLGNVRACVILVEYADTPFTSADPKDQFTRLCNEKGYSDYGSCGSAKDYYEACSGGKFSPTFDVYGPVKLQHEAKWYVGADDPTLPGANKNARFGYAIKEAIEALDDEVDFSIYDYDNNGEIDNIFFFYSGYGQADTGNPELVWPHQASYWRYTDMYAGTIGLDRLYADGVEMTTYACSCELNGSRSITAAMRPWIDGIGAFCHEYGHVLGLPDMYETVSSGVSTKTPGNYTVMDHGSYNALSTCPPLFSSYEKWVCNWVEYGDMENGNDYTLYPLASDEANCYRIRVARPGIGTVRYYPEYYILECRTAEGWDKTIPTTGMLIWHINYDANSWIGNQVNCFGSPRIELIAPSAQSTGYSWPGETNPITYLTPATGQLTLVTTKKPADAVLSGITFDYDNPETSNVTFGYNKYESNDATTVLHTLAGADQEKRSFTLTWDAYPDATGYYLTVKRRSGNNSFTVDGLDETNVGNVTSHTVDNITEAQWKQSFTATLRVEVGIPSSQTSNTLTFIPANLTDLSGVEGIATDDIMIYGGKGEVIAPEGARVFNLSGVETGRQNLPAGVYLVVTPKVSAKVVVR